MSKQARRMLRARRRQLVTELVRARCQTDETKLAALVEIEQNLLRDFGAHGFNDDAEFVAGITVTFAARMVRTAMQASKEAQQAKWTQLCAEAWADSEE